MGQDDRRTKAKGLGAIGALAILIGLVLFLQSCGKRKEVEPHLKAYDSSLPVVELYGMGNSMLPLFHSGDRVYYQPYSYADIKEGDVIVFWRGVYRVAHIALRQEDGLWVTKGINLKVEDSERIGLDEYVGILIVKPL